MKLPIITKCFYCSGKVVEIGENEHGCTCCKVIWKYDHESTPNGWISNRDKSEQPKKPGYPLVPHSRTRQK